MFNGVIVRGVSRSMRLGNITLVNLVKFEQILIPVILT